MESGALFFHTGLTFPTGFIDGPYGYSFFLIRQIVAYISMTKILLLLISVSEEEIRYFLVMPFAFNVTVISGDDVDSLTCSLSICGSHARDQAAP